ncbi:uncharacterized protein LOC136083090 [Hydra vulgaris]|uniref:Uncharacterized protein LOC136083090 n=1 Tax=Hydra vulgaris TaxID=6087 RepID=A0ABM4CA68_HYDVU
MQQAILAIMPPLFDGNHQRFIRQLRTYIAAMDIDEAKRKTITLTCLPPQIYSALEDLCLPAYLEDDSVTYEEIEENILRLFKPKSSLILRFEFATIKKASNESVTEFSRWIARAAEGCKFTDRDDGMRDQFITGFNDGTTIKRLLLKPEVLTFAKAAEVAVTLERVTQEARQLDGSNNVMVAATLLLPQTTGFAETNKITCFNCGKFGHYARDCEAKCKNCSHNHRAKDSIKRLQGLKRKGKIWK